jgi:hypothetical protein
MHYLGNPQLGGSVLWLIFGYLDGNIIIAQLRLAMRRDDDDDGDDDGDDAGDDDDDDDDEDEW